MCYPIGYAEDHLQPLSLIIPMKVLFIFILPSHSLHFSSSLSLLMHTYFLTSSQMWKYQQSVRCSKILKVSLDKEKGETWGWWGGALNRILSSPRAHSYLQSDPVPQSIRITLIQAPDTWFHSSLCETISLEKSCCCESRSLSWGQAKKVLLGLVMTSMKSEVLVRSLGICSVPWPRFSLEAARSLARRKSNEGVDWTAAVGVSISSPILVSNEFPPHLMGNPGWKEEVGCCQGWYWKWCI